MRDQMQNEEQIRDYQNFNKNYGEVYNMIQEEAGSDSDDVSRGEERKEGGSRAKRASKEEAPKKGMFKKLGDKISAGLFKASKMNKN